MPLYASDIEINFVLFLCMAICCIRLAYKDFYRDWRTYKEIEELKEDLERSRTECVAHEEFYEENQTESREAEAKLLYDLMFVTENDIAHIRARRYQASVKSDETKLFEVSDFWQRNRESLLTIENLMCVARRSRPDHLFGVESKELRRKNE